MSILSRTHLNLDPEKVPVIVVQSLNRDSLQFYGFHNKFCRIFDGDEHPPPVTDENIRALPITRLNSCPWDPSFIQFHGSFLLVGGSLLSMHLTDRLNSPNGLTYDAVIRVLDGEFPTEKLPKHGLREWLASDSNRVAAFPMQSFVDKKRKPEVVVGDLETPTKSHWMTSYAQMNEPRRGCQLLRYGGSLLALGGVWSDEKEDYRFSVESFVYGAWYPVPIIMSPLVDFDSGSGRLFVSVALGRPKGILIASHCGYFTRFDVVMKKYLIAREKFDIEFPIEFLMGCHQLPGIVLDERTPFHHTIVLWKSAYRVIIGIHLGQKQYFYIDFEEEKIVIPDRDDSYDAMNISTSKLIGLGEGRLAMVYTGREHRVEVDEQGGHHYLCDYWCVIFEIIYENHNSDDSAPKPYPGFGVRTRVISRRKCYAPVAMDLQAVFVMDVRIPMENVSSSKEKLGLQTLLPGEQ